MATQLLFIVISLTLLSLSSSLLTNSILNAAETLFNSGYISMALILEFGSQTTTMIPPPLSSSSSSSSPSLTIFSPPDTAFEQSGQPSLSLLHLHFSPLIFSLHSLKSLPPGTKIPTFFANHSLTITSSPSNDNQVLLNGVKINGSAIYDDGSLVVFGVEKFFNPGFKFTNRRPSQNLGCSIVDGSGFHSFEEANGVLRARGYSVMALFLDLQLVAEFRDRTMLTIFAPLDEAMKGFVANFSEYRQSVFLRHVVPCKITYNDLIDLDNGLVLPTYLEGFMIKLSRSDDTLMLNGVQVIAPQMFSNNWLVVHGLRGSFLEPERPREGANSSSSASSGTGNNSERMARDFEVLILMVAFSFLFSLCLSLKL